MVARSGSALAGFLVARRELDELHVLLAGVATPARRKGVGSRLFAALIQAEPQLGRTHLEVRESNLPAQAFYRALGFAVAGRRPGHYPGGEAAILMIRTAEPRG